MTVALVDGDIVAYRTAASCEKQGVLMETQEVALLRADELMRRILQETDSDTYKTFLTGSDNYRMQYNPEYKANRKDVPRPAHLQAVREYLCTEWGASVEDGQEADDAMGIYQMANQETIICSIDKDLLMIPGEHYDFVKGIRRDVYNIPAIRHFYWQLIMGDRTDNVFGFDGIARQKVPKKLEHVMAELESFDDELDMFGFVRELYNNDDTLLMNGICLWIRRNEGEIWKFPS
jgi:5'-3' exonuclease, N-terminal resolvase-like domain